MISVDFTGDKTMKCSSVLPIHCNGLIPNLGYFCQVESSNKELIELTTNYHSILFFVGVHSFDWNFEWIFTLLSFTTLFIIFLIIPCIFLLTLSVVLALIFLPFSVWDSIYFIGFIPALIMSRGLPLIPFHGINNPCVSHDYRVLHNYFKFLFWNECFTDEGIWSETHWKLFVCQVESHQFILSMIFLKACLFLGDTSCLRINHQHSDLYNLSIYHR